MPIIVIADIDVAVRLFKSFDIDILILTVAFQKLDTNWYSNPSLMTLATQKTSDQPKHNCSRHRFVCLSMQNILQWHLILQARWQKLSKSQKTRWSFRWAS